MSLKEIIDIINHDGGSWLIFIIIMTTIVQVSPIKINPWTHLGKWIGKMVNSDLITRIDGLEKKLDAHIDESIKQDIRNRRATILDFANSCMNGRKHTKEEFEFIISECDKYTTYCSENHIINGVAEESIKEIKRIYNVCMKDNSFLKEGDVDEQQ